MIWFTGKYKCNVSHHRIRAFSKDVSKLRRKYRSIDDDLKVLFEEIGKDYRNVASAQPIPGYSNRLWKYRCRSTDMRRGGRGGFRLICYLDDSQNMYPIAIYAKSHQSVQDATRINLALRQLDDHLEMQRSPASEESDPG